MDIDLSINRPTDANDQAVIQRRPCRNFFENIMNILTNWIKINKHHLFSRRDQTNQLCEQTRPTSRQLDNWFINARRRILPRILTDPDKIHEHPTK
ncbi:hypothetical protein HN011_006562 [Eciton burchellii]|nr:hypothetical protein HN011_006562 [Eciton burchellii]